MNEVSRRRLLKATGWVAGGVTVFFGLRGLAKRASDVAPTIIFPDKVSAAAWLQIRADGVCVFYLPRVDMGQNANTGLAQIGIKPLGQHHRPGL